MGENIKNLIDGIYENKKESISDSEPHFVKEVNVIDYISASLGALALGTLNNVEKENEVLAKDFPATDMWLSSHLTNIVNTALSIKDLCLNGFDTQARALVRTLDERIYQALILFSSAEDYRGWKNADSSKQAYYEIFSKKKSLLNKITRLENKYLTLSESNHVYLRSLREESDEYYSDCIHGAHVSVIAGALAYPFGNIEEGPFISALFGRASSCSFQTLNHMIGQLAYFSHMLNVILIDMHSIEKSNNEYVSIYCSSQTKVLDLAKKLLLHDDDFNSSE